MTHTKKKLLITYILMLFAMIFWGFSFIWTKLLLQFHLPITIVTLRLIISSAILIFTGLLLKRLQKVETTDYFSFALLSFFQPFLYFIGETIGLNYVSATVSSVLISTIPLFSPIATRIFFNDKLKPVNIIGIIISITGVVLVIINNKFKFDASFIGIILMALAVFAAISYSLIVVKMSKKYNVYSIITYQNTIGIFLFLPLFFYFDFQHFVQVKLTLEILKPLLALSVFASSVAFMFFTYGIRELGLVKANSLSNLIPVFTAIFAYFVLDEKLYFINIIGILIVLCGLFLSQLRKQLHVQSLLVPLKRIVLFKK